MITLAFDRSTPFGTVNFRATFNSHLQLSELRASSDRLNATMRKLSFGDRAEEAGKYFAALSESARYSLSVLPFLSGAPGDWAELHKEITGHGEAVPCLPSDLALDVGFWRKYPKFQEALFFDPKTIDRGLQRMVSNMHRWTKETDSMLAGLEHWVMPLFDLVHPGALHLVWRILGAVRTSSAADFMLRQLERDGIHPQSVAILRGLPPSFVAEHDGERLLAIGSKAELTEEMVRPLLKVASLIRSPRAVELAKRMLFRYVDAAPEAMEVFRVNGVEHAEEIFMEGFQQAELLWVTFRYVELSRQLIPDSRITLAQLNEKLAQSHFTDAAPVVWQQQLSKAWKWLLDHTDLDESLMIIEAYLSKSEARLQYNALLQLNYIIQQHDGVVPSNSIVDRVSELVSHRYEKVAAQAIAAAGRLFRFMADKAELNARLMPISTAPGLRVAKLKLLKLLGTDPGIATQQSQYFLGRLQEDLSPDERMVTRSIVKYLRLTA